MNRIEIRPQAKAEIAQAVEWYEQKFDGLGVTFVEAIGKAFSVIAERPSAFTPIGRGARRFVIHRFPYAIIYRQEGDAVVVYSCFHGHRNPRRWRERL